MLTEQIYKERESIIYYAIFSLKQFIKNGYIFNIPTSSKEEAEEYIIENDNVMQFLKECTTKRNIIPQYSDPFTCANMYRAYVT